MPLITEIPFDYSTLSLSEEDEFRTRTPGLHLTDITKDMLLTSGLGKTYKDQDPIRQQMQFEKGFLWERLIQKILQAQMDREIKSSGGSLIRPGEHFSSGIISTPDALNILDWNLEEWKATAIYSKNLDIRADKPEWLWAAGWHLNHFGMDTVIYRIWHHREFDPVIKQWKAVFTPEELRDNKERIINHARAKGMLK